MLPATANPDTVSLGVLGLGLAVLGFVWLLAGAFLPAKRRRTLLLVVASLGAVAAVAAHDRLSPGWVGRSLLVLVPVGLAAALLASGLLAWLGRGFVRLAGSALVQALVLLVGGVALTASQLYSFDQALAADMHLTDVSLDLAARAALESAPSRVARTDTGHPVPLHLTSGIASEENTLDAEREQVRGFKLEMKLIQTGPADPTCNCHGWVFAAGRYWVRGAFVERILRDNGYKTIDQTRPGDVAIFRDATGQVTHSALVRSVSEDGLVLVESKWGRLGRFVHTADDHIYRGHTATYYRTARGGHQLEGVQSDALPVHEG
jgi:hypothetical protein